MPDFIQPWDKEYWSKGARRKLFQEYYQGQTDQEKQLINARETAAEARRMHEMAQEDVYGTKRDVAARGFNREERLGSENFTSAENTLSNQRRASEAETEFGRKKALAAQDEADRIKAIKATSAEARTNFDYERKKKEERAKLYHVGEALKAITADNPNMSVQQAQQAAEVEGEQTMNALAGAHAQGELAKDQFIQDNPEAAFPTYYGANLRDAALQRKDARSQALMESLGLAPPAPTRSTGLGPMPASPMGGGRVSDAEGEQRKRIKLDSAPKSNLEKYRERWRLGQ